MDMHISNKLFESEIELGKGQYLAITEKGISLSKTKPKQELLDMLEEALTHHSEELCSSLEDRSIDEIETFVENLAYAAEKRNRTVRVLSPSHVSVMHVAMAAYAALALLTDIEDDTTIGEINFSVQRLLLASILAGAMMASRTALAKFQEYSAVPSDTKAESVIARLNEIALPILQGKYAAALLDDPTGVPPRRTQSPAQWQQSLTRAGKERSLLDQRWHTILNRSLVGATYYRHVDPIATKRMYRDFLARRREMTDSGYFVVTHAQHQLGSALTDVLTAITKRLDPERDMTGKRAFRLVLGSDPPLTGRERNAQAYIEKAFLIDDEFDKEVLSVSVSPFDCKYTESALDFFFQDTNIETNFSTIAWKSISEQCQVLDPEKVQAILHRGFAQFKDILYSGEEPSSKQTAKKVGVLNLIAIPESVIRDREKNYVYHSKRYAEPMSKDAQTIVPELERLRLPADDVHTQARILLPPALQRDSAMRAETFSTQPPERLEALNAAVNALVEEIAPYLIPVRAHLPNAA